MVFPFKEKGFLRKFLCFFCDCAFAVLAKIYLQLYREFFPTKSPPTCPTKLVSYEKNEIHACVLPK